MAMATVTRLVLGRSFRRLPPQPFRPPASPSPAGLLQRSPVPQPSALLPGIRWFPGPSQQYSSSTAASSPRGILVDMLPFLSASIAVVLYGLEDVKSPPTSPSGKTPTLLLDWDNGDEDMPPTHPHVEREKRHVTDALIALHLIVHGLDVLTNRKLDKWGTKNNALIGKGQFWRLATSSVLHGGIIHITMNMLALDDFGSLMEEICGPGRFLAIYCTSALAGSLMSYRFVPENSVGASDAIFGLIGALGVYTWRRRESLTSARDTLKEIRNIIICTLALSLALRVIKVRIDNWAHLGGFLGGAVVELVLGPHKKQHVSRIGTMTLEDTDSELIS